MKRLRVLLVCLIVALLCWYPSQHVYCSEQRLGSGQPAQDGDPDSHEHEKDSTQNQVAEKWPAGSSYDMGLETERAEREKLASIDPKQTVNQQETEAEEVNPKPVLDILPVATEPDPTTKRQADLDSQTRTQDHDQESPITPTPEMVPTQDPVSTDAATPEETSGETQAANPSLDSHPTTTPDEAENIATSQSASPTHPGAVRVASDGDELRVDSFVFAEHSDSQCTVIPPHLPICDNSPFGFPRLSVTENDIGDQASRPSDSADVEAEVPIGEEEEKPPQGQELEDTLSSLKQENNTAQHDKVREPNSPKENDPSVPGKEDIPTFDEWKKQVMEVEKEKSQTVHTSTASCSHQAKKVQKNFKNNYASVECGAKILSANNEAKSTSAILMENMDLYMLNPCSNKIWFVIELCEPILVKQLDIANFELFSSTPKDFLVSISDRYPTNKWIKLGTFHARDERIVQSFPLDEQLYAKYVKMFIKYIKVELLSHFGSEHFCPLSLIRVFGTSMVEEYEEVAESQYPPERLEYLDEDYDYPLGFQQSEDKTSKYLLDSATNAIIDIVNNIAGKVLGGQPELEGGAETEGNATTGSDEKEEGADVTEKQSETLHELEEPEGAANVSVNSSISPPSSPELQEDRQIVTLVVEDEEEEEERVPEQSTVTLLEEEGEEEEEKSEDKPKKEADKNQWESQTYCHFSSFSLSLSCMATLPELLHRWCSARLAKERLRSVKRKQLGAQTRARSDKSTPVLTHTPPLIPLPDPTTPQEFLPLTEKPVEPEVVVKIHSEGKAPDEVLLVDRSSTQMPDTNTPELGILLEPSRTTTIPPHSFLDVRSSLTKPTPTHQEKLLPSVKDGAMNFEASSPLQTASIPETQQASSATPVLLVSSTPEPPLSDTPSSDAATPSPKEQPAPSLPTASRPVDLIPPPTESPAAVPSPDPQTNTTKGTDFTGDAQKQNLEASQIHGEQAESPHRTEDQRRAEEAADEELLSANGNGNIQRTATDFYAELQNGGDYNGGSSNGGAVHGSSQKESVFMRLNNRIKALEMNMSLSSRYLEELSQRYRKQMEEMQRAFNKTIIKLQNTSRIAEEQDQKQTDSIQVLQSQLENVTKLMLNLTSTVNQLQREVSDRQSYLVVSLVLCLVLGLLLCLQCCRSSAPTPIPDITALPKSNHYPSPKRCFSSYDDMSLKRRVACPLVRSKSFQLSSSEVGPDDLYIVEPLRFSPEKKKKRCKSKSLDKVETLKPFSPLSSLPNGDFNCNGFLPIPPSPPAPPLLPPAPPILPVRLPSAEQTTSLHTCTPKEFPSETSSCSSSTHSEESFTSRLPPPSPVLHSNMINGYSLSLSRPPAKSRQDKRSTKRRKSRQAELQFPHMVKGAALPTLQQLMKGNKEMSVRTLGVTAVNGHI